MQPNSAKRLAATAAPIAIAAALISACGTNTATEPAAQDPCASPSITATQNAATSGSTVELQIAYTGNCSPVEVTDVTFPHSLLPDVTLNLEGVGINSTGNTHSLSIPADAEYCGYISFLGGEMVGGEAGGTVTINGESHNFSATLNATCPLMTRG